MIGVFLLPGSSCRSRSLRPWQHQIKSEGQNLPPCRVSVPFLHYFLSQPQNQKAPDSLFGSSAILSSSSTINILLICEFLLLFLFKRPNFKSLCPDILAQKAMDLPFRCLHAGRPDASTVIFDNRFFTNRKPDAALPPLDEFRRIRPVRNVEIYDLAAISVVSTMTR